MHQNPIGYVNILIRKTLCSSIIFSLFFFFTIISSASSQAWQSTQRSVYTRIDANVGGFLESVPNDYASNPTKRYPLIIFMHGTGERGNGSPGLLEKVANVGIPKLLKNSMFPASFSYGGNPYSFIVLSPQFETSSNWTNNIEAVISYAKKNYRVDEQRIYLTGLSLGGHMGWTYSASSIAHGQQLAATLLVCPGTKANSTQLNNMKTSQVPIWVTNNTGDPYNSPAGAQALVDAINTVAVAPNKAIITIFTKTGHDAWTATYDPNFRQNGLSVYEWMLSKSRLTAQPNPETPVLTPNAGPDQIITLPTNSVTLDASGSKVSSGTITSYSWTKVSGPTAGVLSLLSNGLQAKLTELVAGVYTYQLTVKDSNGSTATDNVIVTVNAQAGTSTDPPVAKVAQSLINLTLPANAATLDGSLSVAATGNSIVSYKWSKYTGPAYDGLKTPTDAKITVTGLIAGSYGFILTVTDNNGKTDTAAVTVIVKTGTTSTDPPVAKVAQSLINLTLPANATTLDGSLSVAATGNSIVSYKWSKYTGPAYDGLKTPTDAKITVTGLVAGSYGFTLTVTDNNGKTSSANVGIIVKSAVATRIVNPDKVEATASSAIVDRIKLLDFKVSPNPVQSDMNIQLSGTTVGKTSILVYNINGKLQLQQEFTKGAGSVNQQVNISKLPAGIYIVQVIVDGGNKRVLRIVKQQ